MDEGIDFTKFRQQIESLMDSRARALAENKLLYKRLMDVVKERASLLKNKDNVIEKLESIIKRLKAEIT